MNKYAIKLTYFKQSGKYYEEGHYKTNCEYMWHVVEEIRALRIAQKLPGITHAADFYIHVDPLDHPHGYPCLILPSGKEKGP